MTYCNCPGYDWISQVKLIREPYLMCLSRPPWMFVVGSNEKVQLIKWVENKVTRIVKLMFWMHSYNREICSPKNDLVTSICIMQFQCNSLLDFKEVINLFKSRRYGYIIYIIMAVLVKYWACMQQNSVMHFNAEGT